jgi:hypothetical protein
MGVKNAARGRGVFLSDKAKGLDFGHRNSFLITHFHTALTAQALFRIDGNGLSVLHFIDIHRAHLDAFLTSFTLVVVDIDFVSHLIYPPLFF